MFWIVVVHLCVPYNKYQKKIISNNPITYGGGVFKTQVAFDGLLEALVVKIERRYFLTIPKYTYRSV